jgi:methylated-DNA-[protein]-cysteine S-methyltransferase
MKVEADENHITEIIFIDQPVASNPNRLTDLATNQLEDYFSGKRKSFNLPLLLQGTDFQKLIYELVQEIPFGQTVSYMKLAKLYGDEKAIRAVAAANGKNRLAIVVPCHRVVGIDGTLTGYVWGLQKKEWLLQHEGAIQQTLF